MSTTTKIHVTGVQAGRGPNNFTPSRLEIYTHLSNPDRQNLLLLGLERMQMRQDSDMKSWFQISGIHGRPYTPWNGEGDQNGNKPGGYCTHSSILFLTWHRPYLALYEQVLYDDIQAVVASFPEPRRSQLANVAKDFRIPYWDWAAQPLIHPLVLTKEVQVEKPNGKVVISNPLYSYRFKQAELQKFQPGRFQNWTKTIRRPATTSAKESQDTELANLPNLQDFKDFMDIEDRFGGKRGKIINLRERVWYLLNLTQSRYPTYQAFSNNKWVRNGLSSDYDSLESIHDSLHGVLGGIGHMSHPGYAGFDPIFWLHHANVDRLYAIWQGLHWKEDLNWDFGQVAETPDSPLWWNKDLQKREEENTPLVPFRKNNSTYWDSNAVRDFKAFGYTYPELVGWNVPGVSREQLAETVSASIKILYGSGTTAGIIAGADTAPISLKMETTAPLPAAKSVGQVSQAAAPTTMSSTPAPPVAQNIQAPLGASLQSAPTAVKSEAITAEPLASLIKQKENRYYFANIRAPKYDFNGPFVVHVFLGSFTSDPQKREFDPNLVGSWHVFANNIANTGCENCKKAAEMNLIVTGSVPLTSALIERLGRGLESMELEHVVPYLKKNLHWRIHKTDEEHTNVDRSSVNDKVKFAVTSAIGAYPDDPSHSLVVEYRDWNPLPEVTEGRPTGCGPEDAEGYEG